MTDGKETCCFCIEIKTGCTILAVLNAAAAILTLVFGILAILTFNIFALIALIFAAPMLLAGWYCFQWIRSDTAENRKLLIFAMLINIICLIARFILDIINMALNGYKLANGSGYIIGAVLNVYFWMVTKRYAAINGDA